jgi:hypothetical protein
MTVAAHPEGDRRLRASVVFAVVIQIGFIVFLTIFLWNHTNPLGGGMEMAGVGAAFMLIFLPFSLPALILAREGRHLIGATLLAGLAAFLYFALWLELLDELGFQPAPWS